MPADRLSRPLAVPGANQSVAQTRLQDGSAAGATTDVTLGLISSKDTRRVSATCMRREGPDAARQSSLAFTARRPKRLQRLR